MRMIFFSLIISAFSVNATITPEVVLPSTFDASKFTVKIIRENSPFFYRQETDQCNNVKFNDYYFVNPGKVNLPGYKGGEPVSIPVSEWFCLFDNNVYDEGYDTGVLPEKVAFNKNEGLWEIVKSKGVTDKRKFANYKPLKLYNVVSNNSKGFFVINENVSEYDKSRFDDVNIKGKFRFCMIHDGSALCGDGNLIRNIDGKEVDFTPYLLKSLESMELAVKE